MSSSAPPTQRTDPQQQAEDQQATGHPGAGAASAA